MKVIRQDAEEKVNERPKSHFVGNTTSGHDRLKSTAPGKLYGSNRSDVDNLAKMPWIR